MTKMGKREFVLKIPNLSKEWKDIRNCPLLLVPSALLLPSVAYIQHALYWTKIFLFIYDKNAMRQCIEIQWNNQKEKSCEHRNVVFNHIFTK